MKHEAWLRTIVIVFAVVIMQFLNSRYVQLDVYNKDKELAALSSEKFRRETADSLLELKKLATEQAAAFMLLRDQVVQHQQKQLDDHETRIRENREILLRAHPDDSKK